MATEAQSSTQNIFLLNRLQIGSQDHQENEGRSQKKNHYIATSGLIKDYNMNPKPKWEEW